MTDWDLLTPGIGLTSIGIVGVGISLAGIAKTFIDGMHAVSLLTMFIGMIFLASGLFKDGFPSTGKAKSATFITLGFLVTFGFAAAVTVSAQITSIYLPVPPRTHGGTERIVHYLCRELGRRGHQVELFASGDSRVDCELRSVLPIASEDDPDSTSWGGQNVFDVYTKFDGTALDGTKYRDW